MGKPLLHQALNNAAAWPKNATLASILTALETRGPDTLPPRELCKLISFIKNAVLQEGRESGTLKLDDKGYIIGLPENGFQREISAITILAQRINFSPAFHDWVDGRLNALGYRLAREHPIGKMEGIWRGMDEAGRHSYLRAVHHTQIGMFSDNTLPFVSASVNLKKLPDKILGTFEFGGNPLYEGTEQQVISINPSELMKYSAQDATGAVIHEGLHSILRQIAHMHYKGRITPAHPLYNDAVILTDMVKFHSYCDNIFREAYMADPEERIAHKHMNFTRVYTQQSALRAHHVERVGQRPS